MAKELWFVCAVLYLVRGDTDYELYNNNGWIPITNMQAYNPSRSDVIQEEAMAQEDSETREFGDLIEVVTPDTRHSKDFSLSQDNPIQISEYLRQSKSLLKETERSDFSFEKDCGKRHYKYYFKIGNSIYKPSHQYVIKLSDPRLCPDRDNEDSKKQKNVASSDTNRFDRSLKLPEEVSVFKDENIHDPEEDVKDSNTSFKIKTYEVTERAESTDSGYVYETPKPNTSNNLNLTNKLFDILAKYNIKPDDNMQNYILSRRHWDQNPMTLKPVRSFDMKARGYNSLNHLPVDPLLAVFLSHYGHYLPSAYGIRSNYNNAYGYLASNNIHNNKPFGMYKVFSDTDSSS